MSNSKVFEFELESGGKKCPCVMFRAEGYRNNSWCFNDYDTEEQRDLAYNNSCERYETYKLDVTLTGEFDEDELRDKTDEILAIVKGKEELKMQETINYEKYVGDIEAFKRNLTTYVVQTKKHIEEQYNLKEYTSIVLGYQSNERQYVLIPGESCWRVRSYYKGDLKDRENTFEGQLQWVKDYALLCDMFKIEPMDFI